jgi:hypothetical protein
MDRAACAAEYDAPATSEQGVPTTPEKRDARLKTDKADNLVNHHNVIRCQAHLIKLVLGFIINDIR